MSDNHESPRIAELIRRYRIRAGLSQPDLAKKLGVTKNAVTQWEKLDGGTTPRTQRLSEIERALGVAPGTLSGRDDNAAPVEVLSVTGRVRRVPVISYVAAAGWTDVVDAYEPGDGGDTIETDEDVSTDAFALVVESDSMAPEFLPGDRIVVDPSDTPKPGNYVVAKLDARDQATFKKYRPRGYDAEGREVIELAPLNSDWPTLYIDAQNPGHIIGPVVEHRRKLKR